MTDKPAVPAKTTDTPTARVPSKHVSHTVIFTNELNLKVASFDGQIMALNLEKDGRQSEHDKYLAETAVLLADLETGRKMAVAALDAGEAVSGSGADGVQGQRDSSSEIPA